MAERLLKILLRVKRIIIHIINILDSAMRIIMYIIRVCIHITLMLKMHIHLITITSIKRLDQRIFDSIHWYHPIILIIGNLIFKLFFWCQILII
jgi:hypothetical protein